MEREPSRDEPGLIRRVRRFAFCSHFTLDKGRLKKQ